MSDMPNEKAVPFFARYLEGQNIEELSDEDMEAVAGGKKGRKGCGGVVTTEKYPSDQEDGSGGDTGAVTMKYPSDNEDGGGVVTMKYPSDNEESGE